MARSRRWAAVWLVAVVAVGVLIALGTASEKSYRFPRVEISLVLIQLWSPKIKPMTAELAAAVAIDIRTPRPSALMMKKMRMPNGADAMNRTTQGRVVTPPSTDR